MYNIPYLIPTISFVKVAPNEIKPKPCPFCGSSEIDRRIKRLNSHKLGIRVSCSECSCSINLRYAREQGYFDNMHDSAALLLQERSALLNEAVAVWNRRTGEKTNLNDPSHYINRFIKQPKCINCESELPLYTDRWDEAMHRIDGCIRFSYIYKCPNCKEFTEVDEKGENI